MTKRHDGPGHGSAPALEIRGRDEIPLREVSGLAFARWRGDPVLAAVGDRGPDVAYARLPSSGPAKADWLVLDLSTLEAPGALPRVEQAEAIALDGVRLGVVLIEDPAMLMVVDLAERRIEHGYALDVVGMAGVDRAWAEDGSSRGEGLVLMRGGHVLVVKEKRPGGLLEFGPDGSPPQGVSPASLLPPGEPWEAPDADRLVALAWWPGDPAFEDLSDAAIGPEGSLFVLSDQSCAIGRVALPLAADTQAVATLDRIWRLPDVIDKAEGLAFLPDGSAVVAVDHPKVGRNLARLPPVAQWPDGSLTG